MMIDQLSGRYLMSRGEQLINCSTTAYLGLSHLSEFQIYYSEGVSQFGLSYGSSPLTEPRLDIYSEFEEKIASIYQTEDAVLFSSGFLASQAVARVLSDELVQLNYGLFRHPSLAVENELTSTKKAFVTDFIDPIHGQIISKIEIPDEMDFVVIDASHGFGLFDSELAEFGRNKKNIICGSLNKGLSTQAGIVLCSHEFSLLLRNHPMYSTASPPAPAACYGLLNAWSFGVINKQQDKLADLQDQLSLNRFVSQQIEGFPVLNFDDSIEDIFHYFYDNGVLIWFNEYPKKSGQKINRLVIHSGLENEDIYIINELIDGLNP